MKNSPKNRLVDLTSLLDRIIQRNWRAVRITLVRLILVAGVLSFVGILILAITPAISGHYINGITSFGGLPEPDQSKPTLVFVFGAPIVDSESGYYTSTVQRRVYTIFAPKEFSYNIDRFCFSNLVEVRKNLSFKHFSSESNLFTGLSRSHRSSFSFLDIDYSKYGAGGFLIKDCINKNSSSGREIKYLYDQTDLVLTGNSKFFYPFDKLVYESNIWIDGNVASEGEEQILNSIIPRIVGEVFAPNWDVSVTVTESDTKENFGAIMHIEYSRPLIYRLLVPILLVMALGIIFALPFIKDTSTFVETLIGIIFGLWGLHDVLIPPEVTWSTVIDPAILFLFTLIGVFALLRIAVVPAWKKWGK